VCCAVDFSGDHISLMKLIISGCLESLGL